MLARIWTWWERRLLLALMYGSEPPFSLDLRKRICAYIEFLHPHTIFLQQYTKVSSIYSPTYTVRGSNFIRSPLSLFLYQENVT